MDFAFAMARQTVLVFHTLLPSFDRYHPWCVIGFHDLRTCVKSEVVSSRLATVMGTSMSIRRIDLF